MRSNRWLPLLARARSTDGLASLATALGFGPPRPLDVPTRLAIGVGDVPAAILACAGPGTARMLLVLAEDERPAAELARTVAGGLRRRAPHLLWLLALSSPGPGQLVVAAWRSGGGSLRLSALAVDCDHVLPSDAETMDALADSMDAVDIVMHARWLEVLGREAISRRFFVALHGVVHRLADGAAGQASAEQRREVALLHVSRLLFLSFLEARGWLDGDRRFLSRGYDACLARGGGYQRRVLEPLFFGTLNTPPARRAPAARALGRIPFLNGGLFTRGATEQRARGLQLRDEDWGVAYDVLLVRHRFTAAEETAEWQEAAIDPEMLGRAFESLMAERERRATGAYFTPLDLVQRTADTAIEALLVGRAVPEGTLGRVVEGVTLDPAAGATLPAALNAIRVIDPACGSGAFLVHALDRLTRLCVAAGDVRPRAQVRRDIVARSIFGVDVNPTAVWLCELRLWLAIAIDHPGGDPERVPPLPNLDHNIRCGDALAGGDFALATGDRRAADVTVRRARYARATGARKRTLGRELDRLERGQALAVLDARIERAQAARRALVVAARGHDLFGGRRGSTAAEPQALRRLREEVRALRRQRDALRQGSALPFLFAVHFPDAGAAGGFDLVVGNPPWVRVHQIPPTLRERWRREFRAYRDAAWTAGMRAAGAGPGFASQVDVAALFIERGVNLLRPGGVLSFLVPAKLWKSLAGGGVRRLLAEDTDLLALEDWSEAPPAFDAATYPGLLAARRRGGGAAPESPEPCRLAVHRGRLQVAWRVDRASVPFDDSAGSPWVALPPDARAAFDRLKRLGVPLGEAGLGTVTLGTKCGCNAAFLVRGLDGPGEDETVTDGTRTARLPAHLLRPVLRGEAVRAWGHEAGTGRIVFPYDAGGRLLSPLPVELRVWLQPWRSRLEARSDARRGGAWWSLFRLDAARHARPRVVWADIGRAVQALVLPAGDRTVPLNTCYVVSTRDITDAYALAALLNSALATAWLGALCEPARGGYRRFLAWSVARLPVPDDWARAREVLGPIGARASAGAVPGRAELLDAVLDAWRLRYATVAPLLEWTSR